MTTPAATDTPPAPNLPGWVHGAECLARSCAWIKSDGWWFAWTAGGVVAFAVIQGQAFAAYPDPRHTLSAFCRRWAGVYPARPRRAAASIGLVAAFAVFSAHVLVGPTVDAAYADPNPGSSPQHTGRYM